MGHVACGLAVAAAMWEEVGLAVRLVDVDGEGVIQPAISSPAITDISQRIPMTAVQTRTTGTG